MTRDRYSQIQVGDKVQRRKHFSTARQPDAGVTLSQILNVTRVGEGLEADLFWTEEFIPSLDQQNFEVAFEGPTPQEIRDRIRLDFSAAAPSPEVADLFDSLRAMDAYESASPAGRLRIRAALIDEAAKRLEASANELRMQATALDNAKDSE